MFRLSMKYQFTINSDQVQQHPSVRRLCQVWSTKPPRAPDFSQVSLKLKFSQNLMRVYLNPSPKHHRLHQKIPPPPKKTLGLSFYSCKQYFVSIGLFLVNTRAQSHTRTLTACAIINHRTHSAKLGTTNQPLFNLNYPKIPHVYVPHSLPKHLHSTVESCFDSELTWCIHPFEQQAFCTVLVNLKKHSPISKIASNNWSTFLESLNIQQFPKA